MRWRTFETADRNPTRLQVIVLYLQSEQVIQLDTIYLSFKTHKEDKIQLITSTRSNELNWFTEINFGTLFRQLLHCHSGAVQTATCVCTVGTNKRAGSGLCHPLKSLNAHLSPITSAVCTGVQQHAPRSLVGPYFGSTFHTPKCMVQLVCCPTILLSKKFYK